MSEFFCIDYDEVCPEAPDNGKRADAICFAKMRDCNNIEIYVVEKKKETVDPRSHKALDPINQLNETVTRLKIKIKKVLVVRKSSQELVRMMESEGVKDKL